jgi:endonuclease/exonuclease/phosphatase family metal-dependent hydrolase
MTMKCAQLACRGWLAACAVLGLAAWPAIAADGPRVRALTYNIHHGAGMDGKIDLERIAAVIKRLEPDVVALQEVDDKTTRSQGVDQAAELGRLTGMHVAFGKAMDYAEGQYGEAILSRWPWEDVQVHALPCKDGCEPRCVVAARTGPPGDTLRFVFAGTHLEHANASLRLCQAGKLGPELAGAGRLPVILAGDLNAEPGSPPMTVLRRHWTDATDGQWQPTFPADKPRVTLDYVLFQPTDRWRVVDMCVVDEAVASEHRPVLVVLELK